MGRVSLVFFLLLCWSGWGIHRDAASQKARQHRSSADLRRMAELRHNALTRNATNARLAAPYQIVEHDVAKLLQRVGTRVVTEMKKVEDAHTKRVAALNLAYEQRMAEAEQTLTQLQSQRKNLTKARNLLKGQRVNLTRALRADEVALDLATGEEEALASSTGRESALVGKELEARLAELERERKKADEVLKQELEVVLSVRKLITYLIDAKDTRTHEELRQHAAARGNVTSVIQESKLMKEAGELAKFGQELIDQQHEIKNASEARENNMLLAMHQESVNELLKTGANLESLAKIALLAKNITVRNTGETAGNSNASAPTSGNKTVAHNGNGVVLSRTNATGNVSGEAASPVSTSEVLSEMVHDLNTSMPEASTKDAEQSVEYNVVTGHARTDLDTPEQEGAASATSTAGTVLEMDPKTAGLVHKSVNLITGLPNGKKEGKIDRN